MAFSDAELQRIETIEEAINDLMQAVLNLASKEQLKKFTQLKQTDIDDHETRITSLESQISILQSQDD